MSLVDAAAALRDACRELDVPGAPYVYRPLDYAWEAHERFLARYGDGHPAGRVLLVGMNPGPWGMAQTGVPFGDVVWVRDWMGVSGRLGATGRVHPKKPVLGFDVRRREPSGSRLYGWASERFGAAPGFFARFFVANYCPLLFLDEEGRNLTPPQLGARSQRAIESACDEHLAQVARTTRPSVVVGVGQYAEERARSVLDAAGIRLPVGRILHPSPASPAANRGWAAQAESQLASLGVSFGAPPTRVQVKEPRPSRIGLR